MESADRSYLIVEGGPREDERIELDASTSFGRQPGNDVEVLEQGVSREHAEIVEAEGGLLLRDLGSTSGTFVNRRKIADEGQLLKDGDRIRLGAATTTFVFRVPVTEAEESPASAAEAKPAEPSNLSAPLSPAAVDRTLPMVPA